MALVAGGFFVGQFKFPIRWRVASSRGRIRPTSGCSSWPIWSRSWLPNSFSRLEKRMHTEKRRESERDVLCLVLPHLHGTAS